MDKQHGNTTVPKFLQYLPPHERIAALRRLMQHRFGGRVVPDRPRQPPDRAGRALRRHGIPSLIVGCVLAGLTLVASPSPASAGTLDLDYTVSSVHTEAYARRTLNQTNPGLGVEYHWNRTWGVMGGEYLNSYHSPTWYLAGVWTPLHLGHTHHWHLDAGLAAGLATGYGWATGYTGAWVHDPAPSTGWRWTVTRHRYMRNPLSPLMAAGIVRIVTPSGIGLNLMIVPNQGPTSSGFVGFQVSVPLSRY